jgi:hypothetical protein
MIIENNIKSNSENQDIEFDTKDIETNVDYEKLYEKETEIKDIVSNLKSGINNLAQQDKNLKGKVKELAEKLKELNACETDKISRIIKEILKEEIQHNKISVKWIEESLPSEYKRRYEKRKEVSSLSKKKKQTPLLVTDNSGKSFTITPEDNTSTTNTLEKKNLFCYPDDKREPSGIESTDSELKIEYQELKEALEKTTKFQTANNLIKEIQLPKEKSNELQTALKECNAFVFIRFNAKDIVDLIEPDIIREHRFENVNDISNDDYTY